MEGINAKDYVADDGELLMMMTLAGSFCVLLLEACVFCQQQISQVCLIEDTFIPRGTDTLFSRSCMCRTLKVLAICDMRETREESQPETPCNLSLSGASAVQFERQCSAVIRETMELCSRLLMFDAQ